MNTNLLSRLWMGLHEPRKITALQTMFYAVVAFSGACIIIYPPVSLEYVTGQVLSYLWGAFALAGGSLGAFAAPKGRWFLERPAIYLCGTAALFYFIILGWLQLTVPGNRLVQMAFIALAGISLITRFERIKPFDYEPGK